MSQSIFTIIRNHSTDEELNKTFKHLGLMFFDNKETGLTLVKYDQSNKKIYDFNNELVRYARGLVFDRKTKEIVCLPPPKSIHIVPFSQHLVKDEWLNVTLEEFPDGTMINCFNHKGKWHISTRSYIGANCRWYSSKNFNELFKEAKGSLDFEKLNSNYCYTFVLEHPDNRIVTDYKVANICLVQVIEILYDSFKDISLEEVKTELKEVDIDITIPKQFSITIPEDINNILENMDYQQQGIVLKYNGMRSKVRNNEYENIKMLRGNSKSMFYNYIDLRKKGMLKDYLQYFPEFNEEFDTYRKSIETKTMLLLNNYKEAYIFKKKTKLEIPFELRPLCYEMHGIYLNDRVKWDRTNVINFFNRLDPARIIFVINFENNKKFHTEKKETNVEETNVEATNVEATNIETTNVEATTLEGEETLNTEVKNINLEC